MTLEELKQKLPTMSTPEIREHIDLQEWKLDSLKKREVEIANQWKEVQSMYFAEKEILEELKEADNEFSDPFDRANHSYEMAGDR